MICRRGIRCGLPRRRGVRGSMPSVENLLATCKLHAFPCSASTEKCDRVIVDHRDGNGHPSNTLSRQWPECQMAATLPRIFPLGTGPNQRLSIVSVRRSQIRKYVPPGTISLSPSWVKHWKSGSYRPIRSVGPTGGLHSESGHPLTWMRPDLTSNTSPGNSDCPFAPR